MDNKKPIVVNKVKNRILKFSPTVREGLERECTKEDFFSEGDKAIGKGGFGQVWKVRHKATDKIYVIKVMNKQNIIDQKMVDQINREIDIMYMLNHPHIIKLVNHFEDDDNLYLIMHFASKGQLYSLLKRHGRFDQRTTAQYMQEIIAAVKYLHSFKPPIIHRDIKPENILLDENGRVKIADFGWSNFEDKNKRITYCGTPEYLAPEMIKKEGHDTTVDIWDLGVLMFELLTGHPPFSGSNQTELFMNIKKHKINWPDDFPPLAKNLISKILKQNPKERVSLDEILQHAWFEKNPLLKPLLPEIRIDDKAMLESNLLSVKPDNVKDEINKVLEKTNKIRQSIKEKMKNSTASLTHFTGNEVIIHSPSDEMKELKEKCEILKKENHELKNKSDKFEMENKTLKSEVMKLKELPTIKSQSEIELNHLREELDKYKIMNKDRLGLLTEIEEKNNEILEIKGKFVEADNENETLKRNLKTLQAKFSEIQSQYEASEIKITDLKAQIEKLIAEKDEISVNCQKKVEILQAKIFNDTTSAEHMELNTAKILEIVNDSMNDMKNLFKSKAEHLEKFLIEIKEEADKCEKKFPEIISERHNTIIDTINRIKRSIDEDYIKIKLKIEKENSSTAMNERMEWMKKQISELMHFKIKSSNLEIQVSKMEAHIKKIEEMNELYKTNAQTLEKVNCEKDRKIGKNELYITNLEARLCDVKDYLFRHQQDKLEEFKKWYKF
jgi:serine/threonine protein kinase